MFWGHFQTIKSQIKIGRYLDYFFQLSLVKMDIFVFIWSVCDDSYTGFFMEQYPEKKKTQEN